MDKHLKYKLRKELSGILKWAMDGCLLWQREGLEPPEAVKEATRQYKSEMDVISSFLDACCVPVGEIQASVLYQAYRVWAQENGEYDGMSEYEIRQGNDGTVPRTKRKNGFYYVGICLKMENQPYSISISENKR